MKLPLGDFDKKIKSIPEDEPLYKVMKSRVINVNSIKDKEEKKYWQKMKAENRIPDVYLPRSYVLKQLKKEMKNNGKGIR